MVPRAGQSDITIPCEHISYLPAKQGLIPCQQISSEQTENPILYQDVKQMTQVTGAIEEQSEYDQEIKKNTLSFQRNETDYVYTEEYTRI